MFFWLFFPILIAVFWVLSHLIPLLEPFVGSSIIAYWLIAVASMFLSVILAVAIEATFYSKS